MIALEQLAFRVGSRSIIDNVSLQLSERGRTVVLGPNGAGKSVLLRLCLGLIEPSSGYVKWPGQSDARPLRKCLVFQRPVMLRRSALDNITHALALAGLPKKLRAERALHALSLVGLADIPHRPARVLSGGEQQRVALGRAWALEPDVLFLDEPTANLDPTATKQVEDIVQSIHAAGTKIVMTTHNLGQARRMGDEIVLLAHGRLIEHTPADAFFRTPSSPEGAAFVQGELPW
jgi:tungstate transport system ATP-binding protein